MEIFFDEEEFLEEKRRSTAEILYRESNNENRWNLSYLKAEFESLGLHQLFKRYLQKISHGYFSQFLTLQILLISSHLIVLLSVVPDGEKNDVLPDLILYGLISLMSVILLVITDIYVRKHPKFLNILAGIAFVITFFMNAFVPFYNRKNINLRPAYTPYLIISNYIFLNIHKDLIALVMGILISVFHIVMLVFITYENIDTDTLYTRIGSDVIFLFAINSLGMYFRHMNEIVIRRSLLDQRSCTESTFLLKFEEEQENNLMSSVIPKHIIAEVRKSLTEYVSIYRKTGSVPIEKPFKDLYVEEHSNVTILFADIVNYTMMTTQLNVIELLDILNELFGRFDDASEKLKVLRVKFLGDCYYCVAGLPLNPVPNHAEACVDLGLEMISIIADVRQRKQLDINMRIGIHSGSMSSGIIGTIKWQYDIWSKDVDTANKMETEGTAGMVHITKQTKILLHKSYNIAFSNKIVNSERTFLIKPLDTEPSGAVGGIVDNHVANEESDQNNNKYQRRMTIKIDRSSAEPVESGSSVTQNVRSFSLINKVDNENIKTFALGKRHTISSTKETRFWGFPVSKIFKKNVSGNVNISTKDSKRRTLFINSNIKGYKKRLEEASRELEETIDNMVLSKYRQWFKTSEMYPLLLVFKDLKSEVDFIKMPDPLFKYSLVIEVLLLLLVYVLENLTLSKWDYPEWPFYVTLGLIIFVFFPLTWTHYVWTKHIVKYRNELPTNKIISLLLSASTFITNSFVTRFLIYTVVYVLFCICVLSEWLDCYEILEDKSVNFSHTTKQNFLVLMSSENSTGHEHCIIPWHMTETFALAVIMSFLFLRMYMWLKLLYASATAVIYSVCILKFSVVFYGDSQTFNFGLSPEGSHIMGIFFLTFILHLVDRQTEYMNRMNYLWYTKLIEKEEQANVVHKVNTLLLENILPIRVAKLYLNMKRPSSDEVYNETSSNAAIMFASLTNFSLEKMGKSFLTIMSAIIGEFDLILVGNAHEKPIEKIKIAKWTYMAACGLVSKSGNLKNVISLLKFATCLMQKLKEMNEKELKGQDIKLRIGISHGSVAAGVVGSKKPLYDVWGDPVNMASRMDTLGLADHIQVLEPTARVIESYGYVCHYRENIVVKGRRGLVPTYFVALDENFELIRQNISENDDDYLV